MSALLALRRLAAGGAPVHGSWLRGAFPAAAARPREAPPSALACSLNATPSAAQALSLRGLAARARAASRQAGEREAIARLLRSRLGDAADDALADGVSGALRRRLANRGEGALRLAEGVLELWLEEWGAGAGDCARALRAQPRLVNVGAAELRRRMESILEGAPALSPAAAAASHHRRLLLRPAALQRLSAEAAERGERRRASAERAASRAAGGRAALLGAGFDPEVVSRLARYPHVPAGATPDSLGRLRAVLCREAGLSWDEMQAAVARSPGLLAQDPAALSERLAYLRSPEGPGFDAAAARALLVAWPAALAQDVGRLRAFWEGLRRRGLQPPDARNCLAKASFAAGRDVEGLFAEVEAALCGRLGFSPGEALDAVRRSPSLLAATGGLARTLGALLSSAAGEFGLSAADVARMARAQPSVLYLRYDDNLRPKLRLCADFGVLPAVLEDPTLLGFSLERRMWPRVALVGGWEPGSLPPARRTLRGQLQASDAQFARDFELPLAAWLSYVEGAGRLLGMARGRGWPAAGSPPLTDFVPGLLMG